MRLVLVTYWDHASEGDDWVDLAEAKSKKLEAIRCQSVGWIISESDKFIRLAANLNGTPEDAWQCFGVFVLCRADILSLEELRRE